MITISPVNNTQSFGTWLARTDQMALALSTNVVSLDTSVNGGYTTGNGTVYGIFGSGNTLFVTGNLRGGNVTTSNTLIISSNVNINFGNTTLFSFDMNSNGASLVINTNTINLNSNTISVSNSLHVNGMIYANGGVQFGDGTILVTANSGGNGAFTGINLTLSNTLFANSTVTNNVSTSLLNAQTATLTSIFTNIITFSDGSYLQSANVIGGNNVVFVTTNTTILNSNVINSNTANIVLISSNTINANNITVNNETVSSGNIVTLASNTINANNINANSANITAITANTLTVNTITFSDGSHLSTAGAAIGNSISLSNTALINANTFTFTSSSANAVDYFTTNAYHSAEYTVQLTDTSSGNQYGITKLLVLAMGSNAYITEYGTIYTNNTLGTFSANCFGNSTANVTQLICTPFSANTVLKFFRTTIAA